MSTVRMHVNPEMIIWALEQSPDVKLDEKTRENAAKWISGEKTPTLCQIEAFSAKLRLPLGYFFLESPPETGKELLGHRTPESVEAKRPTRNLLDTISRMEDIRDWTAGYRASDGFGFVPVAGCMAGVRSVTKTASRMRRDLGLDVRWARECRNVSESFSRIRERLGDYGITVMVCRTAGNNKRRPLDVNEFRAFALYDRRAPFIFVNGRDTEEGMLFSLLREAACIWTGTDDLWCPDPMAGETPRDLCSEVAMELLLPRVEFDKAWHHGEVDSDVCFFVRVAAGLFRCGLVTFARASLEKGYVNREEYESIALGSVGKTLVHGRRGIPGATIPDRRLISALYESVGEGRTTYSEACRLADMGFRYIEALAKEPRDGSR